MPNPLTRHAMAAWHALRQRFLPRAAAPATTNGHDAHWHARQYERSQREHALFQLRALGWPSA